jgi:hypothetical protein
VAVADSGEQFDVVVSNVVGEVTSAVATLTVFEYTSPATFYVDAVSGKDTNSGLFKDAPWKHAPGMTGCAFNCSGSPADPGNRYVLKGGVVWDARISMLVQVFRHQRKSRLLWRGQGWFRSDVTACVYLDNANWPVAPVAAHRPTSWCSTAGDQNQVAVNTDSWPPRSAISVNGGSNVTIQIAIFTDHSESILGSDFAVSGGSRSSRLTGGSSRTACSTAAR